MDAEPIRPWKPKRNRFLRRFDDRFKRKDTRAHLPVYVRGPLSDLPEKSVEPIAVEAGVAPRTLPEFLSLLQGDEGPRRDRVQPIVVAEPPDEHALGIFDETSQAKKGDQTPGVPKQWCGSLGKTENGIVTAPLGYAAGDFPCLLDGDLYLPESWAADRERCREAGIPNPVTDRPPGPIGLERYDRAVAKGVRFPGGTLDEDYGGKPAFLRGRAGRPQRYAGEIPRSFRGWLQPPRVVTRPYHRQRRGRGRKVPRRASGSRPARRVEERWKRDKALRDPPWQRGRVKDGEKGPMVWECKPVRRHPKDERGLPGEPLHRIVARHVLEPEEIKFFVSNAPPESTCLPP